MEYFLSRAPRRGQRRQVVMCVDIVKSLTNSRGSLSKKNIEELKRKKSKIK